jgi:hypothetical protein
MPGSGTHEPKRRAPVPRRAGVVAGIAVLTAVALSGCYAASDYSGPVPSASAVPVADLSVGDPLPADVAERLLTDESANDRAYLLLDGSYVLARRNAELPDNVRNDIIARVHDRFVGVRTARQYSEVLDAGSFVEAEASRSSGRALRVVDPLCLAPEGATEDDLCEWLVGAPESENAGIDETILVPPPPPAPPPAAAVGG